MISSDDKWYTVCNTVLAAAVAGISTPVNRSLITTGQIAWDDCCNGQLAVSLTRTSPTEAFPTEAITLSQFSDSASCTPPYEVGEITVQIIRCHPSSLNAPTPDSLSAAALQVMTDANQIKRSVTLALCNLKSDFTQRFDYFVRSQLMLGPEGGCAGSELYLYTGLAVG